MNRRQALRRATIAGITLALVPKGEADADKEFDYVNAEYRPVSTADGQCPEHYAYDFQRGDRCVSVIGWCKGRLWTCEGRPETHSHPQFICNPTRKRQPRCCRAEWAKGDGRCWRYKPTRVATHTGGRRRRSPAGVREDQFLALLRRAREKGVLTR